MTNNVLFLCSGNEQGYGKRPTLSRIRLNSGGEDLLLPPSSRTQFPVRACFAITTKYAQKQSFSESPGTSLRQERFRHGQLSVAPSRIMYLSNSFCELQTITGQQ